MLVSYSLSSALCSVCPARFSITHLESSSIYAVCEHLGWSCMASKPLIPGAVRGDCPQLSLVTHRELLKA